MDPNATLANFLDACADQDRETALETLENLQEWISRGGFLPTVAKDWKDFSELSWLGTE